MMMLGSECSQCCGPCRCLPPAITISFSGMPADGIYITKEAIPPPTVTFSVPEGCGGAGAAATATVTGGGYENEGFPVTKFSLTSGGSNYAQLARVEPPLPVISGGSGTGAVFTPTLVQQNDACGLPYWGIQSVSVTGSPQGYVSGESLSISMPSPGVTGNGASITVNVPRTEPTLSIGGDANCTVNLETFQELTGFDPTTGEFIYSPFWRIVSVSVIHGGSNYTSCFQLSITFPPGTGVAQNAVLSARVNGPPTATVSVASASGSAASLSVTFAEDTFSYCRSWGVAFVSIANGGTGYAIGDSVTITSNATVGGFGGFSAQVSDVSEDGEILAVSIVQPGQYFARGPLASVEVEYPGSYWGSGSISGVNINSGGSYWANDKSATPYVSTVTVEALPCQREGGTPATLAATIDTNTASATFGQITGVTIEEGGDCYRAFSHELKNCGTGSLNGNTYKLPGKDCAYSGCRDGFKIDVEYKGESEKPVVFLSNTNPDCFRIPLPVVEGPPFSCSELEFTASHPIHSAVDVTVSSAENDLVTFEQAANAESIEIEVEGEDSDVIYTRIRPPEFRPNGSTDMPDTCDFGPFYYGKIASQLLGSALSGTYTLTKQPQPPSFPYPGYSSLFLYVGEDECGDPISISLKFDAVTNAFYTMLFETSFPGVASGRAVLAVDYVFGYPDLSQTPDAPDPSGCDSYDNNVEWPKTFKSRCNIYADAGAVCPGDVYQTFYLARNIHCGYNYLAKWGYCGLPEYSNIPIADWPSQGQTYAKASIRVTGVNL